MTAARIPLREGMVKGRGKYIMDRPGWVLYQMEQSELRFLFFKYVLFLLVSHGVA